MKLIQDLYYYLFPFLLCPFITVAFTLNSEANFNLPVIHCLNNVIATIIITFVTISFSFYFSR